MEMGGGESFISNGLGISPKSLTISSPCKTTTKAKPLNTGKIKHPKNGGQSINLNIIEENGCELVSPKGSGTPKTLRWWLINTCI